MLIIRDGDGNRAGVVRDVISAELIEQLNGEYTLNFEAVLTAKLNAMMDARAGFELDGQLFDLAMFEKEAPGDGTHRVRAEAEHVSYRLNEPGLAVEDFSASGTAGQILLDILDGTGFRLKALETGGEHEFSAQGGNTRRHLLLSFVTQLGGELLFDNFDISVLRHRGSTDRKPVVNGRHISALTQSLDKREAGDAKPVYDCESAYLPDGAFALGDDVLLADAALGAREGLRVVGISRDPHGGPAKIKLADGPLLWYANGIERAVTEKQPAAPKEPKPPEEGGEDGGDEHDSSGWGGGSVEIWRYVDAADRPGEDGEEDEYGEIEVVIDAARSLCPVSAKHPPGAKVPLALRYGGDDAGALPAVVDGNRALALDGVPENFPDGTKVGLGARLGNKDKLLEMTAQIDKAGTLRAAESGDFPDGIRLRLVTKIEKEEDGGDETEGEIEVVADLGKALCIVSEEVSPGKKLRADARFVIDKEETDGEIELKVASKNRALQATAKSKDLPAGSNVYIVTKYIRGGKETADEVEFEIAKDRGLLATSTDFPPGTRGRILAAYLKENNDGEGREETTKLELIIDADRLLCVVSDGVPDGARLRIAAEHRDKEEVLDVEIAKEKNKNRALRALFNLFPAGARIALFVSYRQGGRDIEGDMVVELTKDRLFKVLTNIFSKGMRVGLEATYIADKNDDEAAEKEEVDGDIEVIVDPDLSLCSLSDDLPGGARAQLTAAHGGREETLDVELAKNTVRTLRAVFNVFPAGSQIVLATKPPGGLPAEMDADGTLRSAAKAFPGGTRARLAARYEREKEEVAGKLKVVVGDDGTLRAPGLPPGTALRLDARYFVEKEGTRNERRIS